MHRLLPGLALLLGLALAGDAAAARWFDLELVVFAREGAPAGDERWPPEPGLPDLATARLQEPAPAGRQLGDVVAQLERSPRYRVLLHRAWRQPTGGRDSTPWVRLAGGAVPGGAEPSLEGLARLSVRRYLHLDLDLVVTRDVAIALPPPVSGTVAIPLEGQGAASPAPAPAPAVASTAWVRQPFRMVDSRRMRSGEVHYIDHPAFGVLALATPYIAPEPQGQDAGAQETDAEPSGVPSATGAGAGPSAAGESDAVPPDAADEEARPAATAPR